MSVAIGALANSVSGSVTGARADDASIVMKSFAIILADASNIGT